MGKKLKLHLDKLKITKKAYLQIDFAIAVFIFFVAFLIFYAYYDSYREVESNKLILAQLNSDSRDICSLLINSAGIPSDFETDIDLASSVGLKSISDQTLSASKINTFNSSNYFTIVDTFGIDSFVYISIDGIATNTNYLTFGAKAGNSALYSDYICYSTYNSEIVKVFVEVWK